MKKRMYLLIAGIVLCTACAKETAEITKIEESASETDEVIQYAPPSSEDEVLVPGELTWGPWTTEGRNGSCVGEALICYRMNKNGGTWEQEVPPVPCDVTLNDSSGTVISGYLKDMVWSGNDLVSGKLEDGSGNTVFTMTGSNFFIPN